jgi:hypothetical protein
MQSNTLPFQLIRSFNLIKNLHQVQTIIYSAQARLARVVTCYVELLSVLLE